MGLNRINDNCMLATDYVAASRVTDARDTYPLHLLPHPLLMIRR